MSELEGLYYQGHVTYLINFQSFTDTLHHKLTLHDSQKVIQESKYLFVIFTKLQDQMIFFYLTVNNSKFLFQVTLQSVRYMAYGKNSTQH